VSIIYVRGAYVPHVYGLRSQGRRADPTAGRKYVTAVRGRAAGPLSRRRKPQTRFEHSVPVCVQSSRLVVPSGVRPRPRRRLMFSNDARPVRVFRHYSISLPHRTHAYGLYYAICRRSFPSVQVRPRPVCVLSCRRRRRRPVCPSTDFTDDPRRSVTTKTYEAPSAGVFAVHLVDTRGKMTFFVRRGNRSLLRTKY